MSPYEQYLSHCRRFMCDYHLSFDAIEKMPLEILLDLEVVDSKIEAAFDSNRSKRKNSKGKYQPFTDKKFIDEIL